MIDRWLRISRKRTLTDICMSLIHTCRSSGANPFEYLLALARNPEAVAAHPSDWLPWNYPKPARA